MVRRARDARLGAIRPPRFTTNSPAERRVGDARWFTGVALLVLGILIGVVFTGMIGQLSAHSDSVTGPPTAISQYATTIPTDTTLPTYTPTTTPLATATPSAALTPTDTQIVAVIQDYIDNESVYTGAYELTHATVLQTQWQGQGQLTACVAFDFASTAPTDTSNGYDMRIFTLYYIDGTWTVTQMGDSDSCSMS